MVEGWNWLVQLTPRKVPPAAPITGACGVGRSGRRGAYGSHNTEAHALESDWHKTGGCSGLVAAPATCILPTSGREFASSMMIWCFHDQKSSACRRQRWRVPG